MPLRPQCESGMGRAMNGIKQEVTRVDEAVVEHTMLIAKAQGDIENLIAGDRRYWGQRWSYPAGKLRVFLRDFKQFTHNIPSGQIEGFFKICPLI